MVAISLVVVTGAAVVVASVVVVVGAAVGGVAVVVRVVVVNGGAVVVGAAVVVVVAVVVVAMVGAGVVGVVVVNGTAVVVGAAAVVVVVVAMVGAGVVSVPSHTVDDTKIGSPIHGHSSGHACVNCIFQNTRSDNHCKQNSHHIDRSNHGRCHEHFQDVGIRVVAAVSEHGRRDRRARRCACDLHDAMCAIHEREA